MFYVYEHIRNDTGECFYIGKGKAGRHLTNKGRNIYWNRVVEKAGGFEAKIVADNLTEKEAFNFEIKLIDAARIAGVKLTNIAKGGLGSAGHKMSEAERARRKLANSGKNNPMYGRIRLDMRVCTGIKNSGFKYFVIATCIETGETIKFEGKRELQSYGFDQAAAWRCMNGKQKQHKGYTFAKELPCQL